MFVECPRCHALYRIKPQQLSAAEGWVRCGECEHIFEAKETLSEEDEQYLKMPHPGIDEAVEHARVVKIVAPVASSEQSPEEQINRPSRSIGSTVLWSLSIVMLIALLTGQYLLSNRATLAQIAPLRPLLTQLCRLEGCTLQPLRSLQSIELLSRNVFTPPNAHHVLAMMATIENTAPFSQPYPVVQISFTDLQGKIVAIGYFKPSQYLPHHAHSPKLMPPNTPVSIGVTFNDPGPQAVSYEFSFH